MTVPMTVIKIWVSDAEGVRIFFVHTMVNTKPSVDNNNCPLPKQCNILFTKNFQFFKALHFPSFCILFYFFIFTLKMFNTPIAFSFVPVLLDLSGRKLVSCLLFVNVVNSVRFNITSHDSFSIFSCSVFQRNYSPRATDKVSISLSIGHLGHIKYS